MGIRSGYIPELDTFRAIAVGAVVLHHYLPKDHVLKSAMPLGWFGVRGFFVLSAFLITRIVLDMRAERDADASFIPPRRLLLRRFYIRRSLRIFPLYYGYLLVLVLFALVQGRFDFASGLPVYLAYAQNIPALTADIGPYASHLWTLAVEEQFYLMWPLVVLFLPTTRLHAAAWVLVLIGPISRGLLLLTDMSLSVADKVTPANLDSLGLGALLALWGSNFVRTNPDAIVWWLRRAGIAAAVALIAYSGWRAGHNFSRLADRTTVERVWFVFFDLVGAVMFSSIILELGRGGVPERLRRLLLYRPLRYLGTISYGIYVLHVVAPGFYRFGWHRVADGPPQWDHLGGLAITLVLSAASWRLYEAPINRMKDVWAPNPPADPRQPSPVHVQ